MHRRKLIASSVAAFALAVPASAFAGGSCNADGRSQVQCGSQNSTTIQKGGAKSTLTLGGAGVYNTSLTVQILKQKQHRGIYLGLIGIGL
jgi:hypothetical protein